MVAGSVPPQCAVGPKPRYPIESVDNALRLLVLFAEKPRIRLTDASEYLEVASSTAHRLLAMLQYRGFVQQDATRAYEPGPVLRGLAGAARRETDLAGKSRPVLERLHADLGGTIRLGRLTGTDVLFVDDVSSGKAIPTLGPTLPAHCSAVGKAVLSRLDQAELRTLYPEERLRQLTIRSIASRSALEADLLLVRRRGFAVSDQECQVGVASVAVALPGLGGVRYGVTAVLPARRMTASTRGGAVRALTDAAAQLSTLV